jgi:hypothetical protein
LGTKVDGCVADPEVDRIAGFGVRAAEAQIASIFVRLHAAAGRIIVGVYGDGPGRGRDAIL